MALQRALAGLAAACTSARLATTVGPCGAAVVAAGRMLHTSPSSPTLASASQPAEARELGVAIAVGANTGDRYENIKAALALLPGHGIEVVRRARLYETAPAHIQNQPHFLNTAVAVRTRLPPDQLLAALKAVEGAIGRNFGGQRFGPRPIDLDVIFYEDAQVDTTSGQAEAVGSEADRSLTVPHKRWHERSFVKAPLADLACEILPGAEMNMDDNLLPGGRGLRTMLARADEAWQAEGGEALVGGDDLKAVLPLGHGALWAWQARPWVMGILNVTPDSFSDGGTYLELQIEAALAHAREMVEQGVDIIDVGGQSTRPHAARLPPEVELQRVMPVIGALAADEAFRDVLIAVDTFHSEVAVAAVAAGAHLVNDVSGGEFDPEMHAEVARLGVPYALMHMRGDTSSMVLPEYTAYGDVAAEVGAELQSQAEAAMAAGIEPWRMILDPGLGFAKARDGNLQLISGLPRLRSALRGALRHAPLLVGPSRKTFLGLVTGRKDPLERDVASAAAAALCVQSGANIVRTHNVGFTRDAASVADAVCRAANPTNAPTPPEPLPVHPDPAPGVQAAVA